MTEVPSHHEPNPPQKDPLLRSTYDSVFKECIRLTKTPLGRTLRVGDAATGNLVTSFALPEGTPIGRSVFFSYPIQESPLLTRVELAVLSEVPSEQDELVTIVLQTRAENILHLERTIEITKDGSIGVRVPAVLESEDAQINTVMWEDNESWGLPKVLEPTFLPEGDEYQYNLDDILYKIPLTNEQGVQLLIKLHELEETFSASEPEE